MYAGRQPLNDREVLSLARHRRTQLRAALAKAREDDDQRAVIEQELRELDAAIDRGSGGELTEAQRKLLVRRAREA